MIHHYDAIVLGLGGMGSATCDHLTRRGCRVLGLEQFPLVHDRGSSHGHTRIIREAYFEHPDYVPLVRRAFAHWYDLEQRLGRHLLTTSSCLNIGPTDGELVEGVRASAREHGLAVEELTASEICRRYPAFSLEDRYVGMLEQNAGFLYVEAGVQAHIDSALATGRANLRAEEPVLSWEVVGNGVSVRTGKGIYTADRLVITAGAWATRLLADIGVPLSVMRQTLLWFAPTRRDLFRRDKLPIYIMDTPTGHYYGLPAIDPFGHKVARHYGEDELQSPDQVDWQLHEADEQPVRAFLERHLPSAAGPRTRGQVCMYTLTPDRHFVIDRHPRHPQVSFACGFSGHGYKFAPVVGEILADLAMTGKTSLPIELFRVNR